MEEEDNDPFGSIVKNCLPTPSQDNALNKCGFARESAEVVLSSDSDSDADGIPVDSTGIIMVSAPESPNNDGGSTEDSFQTPTEDSLPVSPCNQRPPSAVVDGRSGSQLVAPANTPASERTVESSKGSSNLRFSGMRSVGAKGCGTGIWQEELLSLLLSLKRDGISPESVRKKRNVDAKVIDLEGECHQKGGGLSETVIDLENEEEEAGAKMRADQVTDELPVRGNKAKLAIRTCKEVPENFEEGYEAGPKMGAGQVTDELPVRGNKAKLAIRICKEVPENCEEEGYAKKRSESRDRHKRSRVGNDSITIPSGENQMDVDLPRKDVALGKGKKVCETDDQGLARKGRVNLDGFKQVTSTDNRKAEGLTENQVDVHLSRKEILKDVALDKGKVVCENSDEGLARVERADGFKQVSFSDDRKAEACTVNQMDVDCSIKEIRKDRARDKGKGVCEIGDKGLLRKNTDDLDGFKQLKSSGNGKNETGVSGKRSLPSSITGQGENAKWGVASSRSSPKYHNVEKLLDGLKRVAEKLGEGYDDDPDIDFFEMAKRRGMTFPRPRWWPNDFPPP